MEELDARKVDLLAKIQRLKERINEYSNNSKVEKLESLLRSIQDIEQQESEVLSCCVVKHSKLQAEVNELEGMLQDGMVDECLYDILEKSLHDSNERLNLMKMELASMLRTNLSLKQQIDCEPIPAELIQYELCFKELYTNIQRKLRQTQKLYETYNALLEIKELMVKETSLLNSLSSQVGAGSGTTLKFQLDMCLRRAFNEVCILGKFEMQRHRKLQKTAILYSFLTF